MKDIGQRAVPSWEFWNIVYTTSPCIHIETTALEPSPVLSESLRFLQSAPEEKLEMAFPPGTLRSL